MCAASSDSYSDEEEPVSLSALQHYLYCPRQCALIHVEQSWQENRSTAEGRLFHERVHDSGSTLRDGILTARGLRLASTRLGLTGIADAVEFHRLSVGDSRGGSIPSRPGWWLPFPVEYKKGRMKKSLNDAVQLCGQALCLEEMLNLKIPAGAIFYGQSQRRREVAFDQQLRQLTEETTAAVHALLLRGITPPAKYDKRCHDCSLLTVCCPQNTGKASSKVKVYCQAQIAHNLLEEAE